MRLSKSRGGMSKRIEGYDEIKKNGENLIDRGNDLGGLAEKFIKDKDKLEDAIDRVKDSDIKLEDKKELLAELNAAIEKLQHKYELDVMVEEARVHDELEEEIESIGDNVIAFNEQIESIKDISIETSSTNTDKAVEEAQAKKEAFETMGREYTEKLRLQMELAENRQRAIRTRRMRGN